MWHSRRSLLHMREFTTICFNSVNSTRNHNGLCLHARLFNSCYLLCFEPVQTFITTLIHLMMLSIRELRLTHKILLLKCTKEVHRFWVYLLAWTSFSHAFSQQYIHMLLLSAMAELQYCVCINNSVHNNTVHIQLLTTSVNHKRREVDSTSVLTQFALTHSDLQ